MISDHIDQIQRYEKLHPLLSKALPFLQAVRHSPPAPGSYPIDGERLFAIVQTYTTRDAAYIPFEVHYRYLDLQYVLSGQEAILHCPKNMLAQPSAYSKEKDCLTADKAAAFSTLALCADEFALFYPGEAHKPKCTLYGPETVIKIIIKLSVSDFSAV